MYKLKHLYHNHLYIIIKKVQNKEYNHYYLIYICPLFLLILTINKIFKKIKILKNEFEKIIFLIIFFKIIKKIIVNFTAFCTKHTICLRITSFALFKHI